MDQAHLLASHIAHETHCRLQEWMGGDGCKIDDFYSDSNSNIKSFSKISKEASPERLVWMCERIEKKSEHWPSTKLHRWIGHIHGCALALGIFTFNDLKDIVSNAKTHFPEKMDSDLFDHLDERNPFRLDIGGES